jgi:hypothetical protein
MYTSQNMVLSALGKVLMLWALSLSEIENMDYLYCKRTNVNEKYLNKTIAHKWNTGFSQFDHRIYQVFKLNKSLIGITLSSASQINLAIPAESIRRS